MTRMSRSARSRTSSRRAGADEVLISTHPPKQSNWLETGIVNRLREELDIPVTHLVVETVALQ